MQKESISIKAKESTNDVLDFNFLKQKGIEKIQQLSGKVWTDYNVHDPGITILENLCYAVTELGYRTKYAVKDLLAKKDPSVQIKDTLFIPSEILPSNPLTSNDYRKVLLDIEGIKNAFVYPSNKFKDFRGVYEIDIELFPGFEDALNRNILKQEITLELNMNRNLCEDFNEINFLENDLISVSIDLEVNAEDSLKNLMEDIYSKLFEYFSPTVNFQSLEELIEKGYKTEDIFEGPLLKNGFIFDSDLEKINLKKEIYTSDIIHILMDINNVKNIKKISLFDSDGKAHKWICNVKEGKTPKPDIEKTEIRLFNLEKQIKNIQFNKSDIEKIIRRESNRSIHKRQEFIQEEAEYKNLIDYYSIQNEFPEVYGIGYLGLQPNESNQRKGQAKQLKAYLLFFEQILANFFAQLENLNLLFSIENIDKTYFSQPLTNIPGIEFIYQPFINKCIEKHIDLDNTKIIKSEWSEYLEINQQEIVEFLNNIIEDKEKFTQRRNIILDHLLARLGFDYSEYRFSYINDEDKEFNLIKPKLNILNNYLEITANRAKAFKNIFADLDDETNISGFEALLNNILELKSSSKKFPFDFIFNNLQLEKSDENQQDNSIIIKNTNNDDAFKKLILYADNSDNFQIVETENQQYKIILCNEENVQFAEFTTIFENQTNAEEYINNYSKKIKLISENSESIHVFERIFLRPHTLTKYFRFSIRLEGETIFNYENFLSFSERKELIEKIIETGTDIKNYSIRYEAEKQFKILMNFEDENLIISRKYFESAIVAQKEIEKYAEYFSSIKTGKISEEQYIKYFTKHYDLYNLTSDPYSFILTIIIPDWSKRFQNERFQKHVENIIKNEIPAHIYPDIKWVNIREMKVLYQTINEYQNLLRKRKPEYEKIEKVCDELYKILV